MKKTFNVGEWGYSDKYKIELLENKVIIESHGRKEEKLVFTNFESARNYLYNETSCYYADKMLDYISDNCNI